MPPMILVAQAGDGTLAGFLEAGLRWYADGCEARYPVGLYGWLVRRGELAAAGDWNGTLASCGRLGAQPGMYRDGFGYGDP